jgi:hypothetical protein
LARPLHLPRHPRMAPEWTLRVDFDWRW